MTPAADCRRLFNLAEAGFGAWPAVGVGIGLVLIGVALAWFMPNASATRRWNGLVFALVWASLIGITTHCCPKQSDTGIERAKGSESYDA
jgi:hypothetical protein